MNSVTASGSPGAAEEEKQRVLVVDDNVDAADLLAEALRLMGFDTEVAHDGPAALNVAADFQPDSAVVDIGLPTMDGYELGERLRALLGPGLMLMAVTGYGGERDREQSRKSGFDEHFVKPVDLHVLVQTLKDSGVGSKTPRAKG